MDKVSKDIKLSIAKDILGSYVKTGNKENTDRMDIDEFCAVFKKIYKTLEELAPENIDRKIGLG